ncbi:unnamed protein product [Mycena citricolor]|uniref:Nucleoside transporter n=1 Tax=Mycena citricolor TaxID=2018698 RepID=A0AAD2HFH9_9AGAR|nr:unnamed protein product [Mycena citricolor]
MSSSSALYRPISSDPEAEEIRDEVETVPVPGSALYLRFFASGAFADSNEALKNWWIIESNGFILFLEPRRCSRGTVWSALEAARRRELICACSDDNCLPLLSLSSARLPDPRGGHIIHLLLLHVLQLHLPRKGHRDLQAGTSPSRRVSFSTLALAVLTMLLTLSTFTRDVTPAVFFAFVLANGILQAAFGAHLQTAIIVIASLFGPAAVQATMAGQAGVAVAVSSVQFLSALAFVWGQSPKSLETYVSDGEPEARSAMIFFGLSTVFLVFTVAANAWLVNMPAYRTIAGSLEHRKDGTGSADELRGLVSSGRVELVEEKGHLIRIAKVNAPYELAVCCVFLVTLACFPAITTSVMPTNPKTHPLLFSALHFLIFNVGDFGGRYLCSFPRLLIWSANRLLTLSFARALFVPLFLMCNVQSHPGATNPSAPIINSDVMFFLLLLLFGVSNGYVSSLCLMAAPSLEHNPRLRGRKEDVDVAATVATFCTVGGLVLGSFASFAVRAAVCECNPFTEQ